VGEELTTAQAVERAIRLAQDAVRVDEAGSVEEAIALYTRSVDLIKHGLKVQSDSEVVDSAVLHKYSDLYSERIAELSRSLVADSPSAPASGTSLGSGAEGSASKDGKDGSSFAALMDDTEQKSATPPEAPPTGRDEWRRPFWLMRTLKTSMLHGGYLTPDGRVFAPRRLWVQRGSKYTGMAAKVDCAQCLVSELGRIKSATDPSQPAPSLQRELPKLCETLDALQNSLHRLLPFVPEVGPSADQSGGGGINKLTERFKGLAKTLDKTAARLGALPTKCNDPAEYVTTLVALFDAAAIIEEWMERWPPAAAAAASAAQLTAEDAELSERLSRCATFFYEVVCAFVLSDLEGLAMRYMRKSAASLIKVAE